MWGEYVTHVYTNILKISCVTFFGWRNKLKIFFPFLDFSHTIGVVCYIKNFPNISSIGKLFLQCWRWCWVRGVVCSGGKHFKCVLHPHYKCFMPQKKKKTEKSTHSVGAQGFATTTNTTVANTTAAPPPPPRHHHQLIKNVKKFWIYFGFQGNLMPKKLMLNEEKKRNSIKGFKQQNEMKKATTITIATTTTTKILENLNRHMLILTYHTMCKVL